MAPLAGRDAGDNVGAVAPVAEPVEAPLAAGEPGDDQLGLAVDRKEHVLIAKFEVQLFVTLQPAFLLADERPMIDVSRPIDTAVKHAGQFGFAGLSCFVVRFGFQEFGQVVCFEVDEVRCPAFRWNRGQTDV